MKRFVACRDLQNELYSNNGITFCRSLKLIYSFFLSSSTKAPCLILYPPIVSFDTLILKRHLKLEDFEKQQ